jgi:hypothetical protein
MTDIAVRCTPSDGGWRCAVRLGEDDGPGSRDFDVTVAEEDAVRLAAARGTDDVERLVDETFRFLLERESASSILRAFDLTVVTRYFPEYDAEIAHRLAP